jgi:hypothetical protein
MLLSGFRLDVTLVTAAPVKTDTWLARAVEYGTVVTFVI